MTPAMISRSLNGAQLGIRYGLRDEAGVRSQGIAGSAIFAVGLQSSVALTAGVADADCGNCSPELMLGVGGDMRVFERGNVVASGSSFTIAVSGDVGYAQPRTVEHAVALGVGAPTTLVLGATREGMRIATYFTPVFGIGNVSAGCPTIPGAVCENSGTRVVLGGRRRGLESALEHLGVHWHQSRDVGESTAGVRRQRDYRRALVEVMALRVLGAELRL